MTFLVGKWVTPLRTITECNMDIFVSKMMNPSQTITVHIDNTLLQRVADNHHVLKKIAKAFLFCGRQCIALRGDEESLVTAGNPGNFLAFLKQQASSIHASIGQSRLSSLALMHKHYDIPVDVSNTVDLFAAMFPYLSCRI